MLSRFRKEVAAVELYGKLPIAKDYLRVGGAEENGIAFRDWLDRGFSPTRGGEHRPSLAWPGRFIISDHLGDPLMGCCWPSGDSGGLRPFPFTTFLSRRKKPLLAAWEDGGVALRPLWEEMTGVFTAHRSYGDGESYLAAMRGRSLSIPKPDEGPPQRVDFTAWVSSVWPEGGQEELVDVLAALKRRGAHEGPIRLPIVAGLPTVPQVHAWWLALTELELLSTEEVPTAFFPLRDDELSAPLFVAFFRGPLQPSDQSWLAAPDSKLGPGDFASRVIRAVADAPPVSEATPPLAESMRGPLISARSRA